MAVKPNIPSLALRKLNELYWSTKSIVNGEIFHNYIEYLGCPTVDNGNCGDVPCDNPTIIFTCTLSLRKLTEVVTDNKVDFSILDADIANGLKPYTYKWTYDANAFQLLSGGVDQPNISLSLKPPKIFSLIVSKVTLEIIDGNNCKSRKDCYITPNGLECNNFVPCPPTSNLTVTKLIKPITIYYGYKDTNAVLTYDQISQGITKQFNRGDIISADYTANTAPKFLWVALPSDVIVTSWYVNDLDKGVYGNSELFTLPVPVENYNFYITNYLTEQSQLPIKFLS